MRGLVLSALLALPSVAETQTPSNPARVSEVQVLAKVAGTVVTDRKVLLETFLEIPELYVPGDRRKKVSKEVFEQSLQRLIAEIMATEDNRIVGLVQISDGEVNESLASLKKTMGANWGHFLADFETNETELRGAVTQKTLLRKSLAARVKAATVKVDSTKPGAREELAQAAIADWFKQLRSRYRVQMYRDQDPVVEPQKP